MAYPVESRITFDVCGTLSHERLIQTVRIGPN